MSIFKEKKAQFQMNLSGTKVSFDVPTNFSREFGYPESFKSTVNVFDTDNNPQNPNIFLVYDLFWSYISGLIIKDTDGTMSMSVLVEKIVVSHMPISEVKYFKNILAENFKRIYDDVERKRFKMVEPHDIKIVFFPTGEWLNYQYAIGTSEKMAYSILFSDTHYLTISFQLMVNYNEERFLKKAKKHIQEIMNSFKITPP